MSYSWHYPPPPRRPFCPWLPYPNIPRLPHLPNFTFYPPQQLQTPRPWQPHPFPPYPHLSPTPPPPPESPYPTPPPPPPDSPYSTPPPPPPDYPHPGPPPPPPDSPYPTPPPPPPDYPHPGPPPPPPDSPYPTPPPSLPEVPYQPDLTDSLLCKKLYRNTEPKLLPSKKNPNSLPNGERLNLAPEDEELLRDDDLVTPLTQVGAKRRARPSDEETPWLLPSEHKAKRPSSSLKQIKKQRPDQESGGQYIVEDNSRQKKIEKIKASFEASKKKPVHATDKQLYPLEVLPFLPDFDRLDEQFGVVSFDGEPIGDSKFYDKLDKSARHACESMAIMKRFASKSSTSGNSSNYLSYMAPLPEEDVYKEDGDLSFSCVRDYHYDVCSDDADHPQSFLVSFDSEKALYVPLPLKLKLKKRKAMSRDVTEHTEAPPPEVIVRHIPIAHTVEVKETEDEFQTNIEAKSLSLPKDAAKALGYQSYRGSSCHQTATPPSALYHSLTSGMDGESSEGVSSSDDNENSGEESKDGKREDETVKSSDDEGDKEVESFEKSSECEEVNKGKSAEKGMKDGETEKVYNGGDTEGENVDKEGACKEVEKATEAVQTDVKQDRGPLSCRQLTDKLKVWKLEDENIAVRDLIITSPLYCLVRCSYRVINRALISAFIERWNPETNTFKMPFGEMTITLDDVEQITGLPVTGKSMTVVQSLSIGGENLDEFVERVLGTPKKDVNEEFRRSSGNKYVRMEFLRKKLSGKAPDTYSAEQVARGYLLYLLGCTLFQDKTGNKVNIKYLYYLELWDSIGDWAWGAGGLAYLYRELRKGSRLNTNTVSGYLTLVEVWVYEHFPHLRPAPTFKLKPDMVRTDQWKPKNRYSAGEARRRLVDLRANLDDLRKTDVDWTPYQKVEELLDEVAWYNGTIMLDKIIEPYQPCRVVRQFGHVQRRNLKRRS